MKEKNMNIPTSSQFSRRHLASLAAAMVGGTGLAAASGMSPASAAVTGYTTGWINLRDAPNFQGRVLGTIPRGTALSVQCQTEGAAVSGTYQTHYWAKVSYNGNTGYAARAYIRIPNATGLGACAGAPQPPAPDVGAARRQVLDRGMHWVRNNPGYSMYNWAPGPDADGYKFRTDCSGMVALAYNLRDKNYYTGNLTDQFYAIDKNSLVPGDIIGNLGPGTAGAAGHVVIFNGWEGSGNTRFRTIEQNGGHGAVQLTHTWGTSYWNKQAYRRKGW